MEAEDKAAAPSEATVPRSLDDVLRDPATAWGDVRAVLRRRSLDDGTTTHAGLLLALNGLGGDGRRTVAATEAPPTAIPMGKTTCRGGMWSSSLPVRLSVLG